MASYLFDLECDGLTPSEIFVIGMIDIDTNEFIAYTGDDIPEGIMRLLEADCLIGHAIKSFDIPQIERLTDGAVKFDRNKLIDTLEMSKMMFPEMKKHKLKVWGEILGVHKLPFKDFYNFSPEMVEYCKQDCVVNKVLYEFFLTQI